MNAYLVFLNSIIALAGVAFVIGQWRNGYFKGNVEALAQANAANKAYQDRIGILEENMKLMYEENKKTHDEVIRMGEQLKHKDDLIKQYVELLQNRNPELVEFMKFTRESAKLMIDNISSITERMEAIDGKFNHILSEGKLI